MANTTIESMITHLEFLGYTITRDEEDESAFAIHESQYNKSISEIAGGVLFRTEFISNNKAKEETTKYLESINEMNVNALVIRALGYEYDGELSLHIEAWYPNQYDRVNFGNFIDAVNRDCRNLLSPDNDVVRYIE